MLPPSLALPKARPRSPPCHPRQGPRPRLPTTAGARMFLAPVPRLPKFILPNRPGLSCPRRVGEGTALPWDSRASPQAASSPQAPQPPSATDPVTSSVAPTSRSTDQSAAPRGRRLGTETTPHSPAGPGTGTGVGKGSCASRERQRPLLGRKPTRPRQTKWGGGELETGEGLGRRGQRAGAKDRPPTSVDAGRWSPVSREKLTK